MNKYTVHTCFKGINIHAELDTFEEMQKVVESVMPLTEPEPEPAVYLDATGKEFGLGSVLAFADSADVFLVYIGSMEWCSKTNKWKIWFSRLTGSDDGFHDCEIKGEGGKPHPQLFKLEATFQEYMDASH